MSLRLRVASVLDAAGIPFTAREAQIPRHIDSAKRGDILVQCKVAPFPDLVLDFSLTHPRTGASNLHPIGSWKPDALANADKAKSRKHAVSYEQSNHAFLSLTADTYGKVSDDFVRFLWLVANTASTNSRLSQSPSEHGCSQSQDSFATLRGSFFSRIRVQVGAALAKAAAARFVPDSADDGLPLPVLWDRKAPGTAASPHDLPLYHRPSS